ncbi:MULTISPECIES: ATP-binding protein [unclassified Streptomyces]|uniref:ATP-binding protein n=1 Tax=unclassified Streptomyces TaxID=2593676 RepID=UPI0033EFC9AB
MQPQGETRSRASIPRPRPARSVDDERAVRTSTQARDVTRRRLAGIRPSDESQVDDLLLVVSELVTNAERHGGGLIDFRLDVTRDTATVSVSDASEDAPLYRRHEPLVPGGFGWPIVLHLCREVAVTVRRGGKTIHAVVPLEQ